MENLKIDTLLFSGGAMKCISILGSLKYLFEKTHYNSTAEIIEYCNNHNLKVNLTYTYPYYLLRLCRLFNIDLDKFNFYKSSSVLHHMTFYISERIACITLHVTKSTK